ncbi:MAG: hypothetical protein U0R64_04380 [Candidatus Nanopelagicales bacterium]
MRRQLAPVGLLCTMTLLIAACAATPQPGTGPTTPPDAPTGTTMPPDPIDPSPPEPSDLDPSRAEAVAKKLIDMTEAEATAAAADAGMTVRVVERDGQQFPVTMDYSPTRINLTITGDRVTGATVG